MTLLSACVGPVRVLPVRVLHLPRLVTATANTVATAGRHCRDRPSSRGQPCRPSILHPEMLSLSSRVVPVRGTPDDAGNSDTRMPQHRNTRAGASVPRLRTARPEDVMPSRRPQSRRRLPIVKGLGATVPYLKLNLSPVSCPAVIWGIHHRSQFPSTSSTKAPRLGRDSGTTAVASSHAALQPSIHSTARRHKRLALTFQPAPYGHVCARAPLHQR